MNTPIVEIFKTINSYYIYDGVKCEIVAYAKELIISMVMDPSNDFYCFYSA